MGLSVEILVTRLMMASKIFLTGATGYIGGEALVHLAKASGNHVIRCLVRDQHKADAVSKVSSKIETVIGDLDDADLVKKEASNADVVFHLASTRHEVSSRAIAEGLSQREKPGYWIQISGASMFSGPDIKAGSYGEAGRKTYDDLDDIQEVIDIIKASPARVVDNLVLVQDPSRIKTAIIPGPMFYGEGQGPLNVRSIQCPEMTKYTLQNGFCFEVGKGRSEWSNVHIQDLGSLFALLYKAAVNGTGSWNDKGIYLPENGGMNFGEIAKRIAQVAKAQGYIESDEVKSLSVEETNSVMPHGAILLGTNAKIKSSRARQELGWQPSGPSLGDDLERLVKDEAKRLGK